MNTIHIESTESTADHQQLSYLRNAGETHPFAYVERVGVQWWAAIPGGDVAGYFPTRSQAIAAVI